MAHRHLDKLASSLLIKLLLLSSLGHVANNLGPVGRVHCSSSYIDDYILPTAKVALTKIQQSLASPALNPAVVYPLQARPSSDLNNKSTHKPHSALVEHSQAHPMTQFKQDSSLSSDSPQTTTTLSRLDDIQDEPNKSEFVNLEVRPDGSGQQRALDVSAPSSATRQQQEESAPAPPNDELAFSSASSGPVTVVVSSTESSSQDPTLSSVALNTNADGAVSKYEEEKDDLSPEDPPKSKESPKLQDGHLNLNNIDEITTQQAAAAAATTTTTTTISTTTTQLSRQQQDVNASTIQSSGSADEAFRETELEAIAALDASIAFGDTLAGATDACYDEYGNARYCEPEFENVAFERQVEVSSECGHPPSRFCTTNLNERSDQVRNCHICDSQHPKKRHPAAYLTDMNNPNSPTCWVSAPISANTSDLQDWPQQQESQVAPSDQMLSRDNVTLTLDLEKRYEITYVSLQFCSLKPDSLAIWKSADFGKSWQPYQFYSSRCARVYERPSASLSSLSSSAQLNKETGQLEATCVNGSSSQTTLASNGRIAFSTLNEAVASMAPPASGSPLPDKPPALQDWMTATNIRIVLDRHQASWIQSSLAHSHHHLGHSRLPASGHTNNNATHHNQLGHSAALATANSSSSSHQHARQLQMTTGGQQAIAGQLENSLTSPSDTYNYALSDLTVGARCKCNGHASRCVHGRDGKLQCDCQHNTDGPDCERCLPLHHDRPWQRATQANANPCQPCSCNGHSRKCRFDPELYLLSGKRSGGVCIDCKDSTTGRHCNYCKEGFTRDHTRPMSARDACKPCDCHPVGSLGKVCNHTTGQCPCKEGVTGLECNRCAPGYQQSSSPSEPCIRLPENDINYEPSIEVTNDEINPNSVVSHQSSGDQEPGLAVAVASAAGPDDTTTTRAPSGAGRQQRPGPNSDSNNLLESIMSSAEEQQLGVESSPANPPDRQVNPFRSLGDDFGDTSGRAPLRQHQMRYQLQQHQQQQHQQHQQHQQQQQHHHQRQHSSGQWHAGYKPNGQWHEYPNSAVKPSRSQWPGAAQTFDGPSNGQLDEYDELEMLPHGRNDYQARQRPSYTGGWSSNSYASHMNFRPQGVRSMASLDHNEQTPPDGQGEQSSLYPDELQAGGYAGSQAGAYGAPPTGQGLDEPAIDFNRLPRPPHRASSASQAQAQQQGNIHSHFQSHKHRGDRPHSAHHQSQSKFSVETPAGKFNKILCADCQSRLKKLNSRQFCHLDYAIRATVLNRRSSPDWTRIDVEILDIFKSPSSSARALQPSANSLAEAIQKPSGQSYGAKLGSDMQADEPQMNRTTADSMLASDLDVNDEQKAVLANADQKLTQAHHRLKVGSVQSIWVPTEDVACKCPRLKVHSTYLLMGLVDARDNSATSIQLDRHGVALVWRASFQEKLIKYQRIHSEGRC